MKKIHKDIHGSNGARKRDQARAALEAIRDEKAIPSLYREFGGGQTDQLLLIQALERIDKPLATKVLAMLAVYGRTPKVRRKATEILRGRPAGDYLELLVGLLVDTFKYEVKPVGGPGSPGVLFVEGQRYQRRRGSTRRLRAPNVMPQPGDMISYDQLGMPVITRPLAFAGRPTAIKGAKGLFYQPEEVVQFSASQMMAEAQRGAAVAESQLESDVAEIKATNADRRHFNELVMSVASYATGKSAGDDPEDWRNAVGQQKSGIEPQKPTVTELIPLAYQPRFAQLGFMVKITDGDT